MTPSRPGTVLQNAILAEFGALPDRRLWRNTVASAWVGKIRGRAHNGIVTLEYARVIESGLCEGAADLVGILPGGRFWAVEAKAPGDSLSPLQRTWLRVVNDLGGLAGVAGSVEDVRIMLREIGL